MFDSFAHFGYKVAMQNPDFWNINNPELWAKEDPFSLLLGKQDGTLGRGPLPEKKPYKSHFEKTKQELKFKAREQGS